MSTELPPWWPTEAVVCYVDLVTYHLIGASACADRITDALVAIAAASESNDRNIADDLADAAAVFCALKPDTALYRNLADHLNHAGRSGRATDVLAAAASLSAHRQGAREGVIAHACGLLQSADTLLVHDYSSMVMRIVERLGTQRPRQVVVTAGEPLGQGARVAAQAAAAGHHITFIPDMSAARIIGRVDCFLTGVECFYGDGSLANTVGTLMLSLLCHDADVPVIAPAETLKCDLQHATVLDVELTAALLHPWPPARAQNSSEWHTVPFVLDAVPAALITYYVTEDGKSTPNEVGSLARTARLRRTQSTQVGECHVRGS